MIVFGLVTRQYNWCIKLPLCQKKNIKSWLAKQALWQVHIPPPKEISHPHYDVTEPNDQHQFDTLYMPHNPFEGNTYKYIDVWINRHRCRIEI